MRNASVSNKITFLVLRDANQSVKQIQVSKPLVIAVPMFALLSISGFIVNQQMNSNEVITRLEKQLNTQHRQFEAVVTNKEAAIQQLHYEIVQLSEQSQDMMSRMDEMTEMEIQLQTFINKYGVSPESSKLSSLSWDDSQHVGGEYIAVYDNTTSNLAQETKDDLQEMNEMLDKMEKNIPTNLQKARAIQASLSGIPSTWPTLSTRLTSSFGFRSDPFSGKAAFHAGIDIGGKTGDPVYAAAAGKVVSVDNSSSRGKYIVIQHPKGLSTWYMHLNSISVAVNDNVRKGQLIGELGSSGRSTGAHLHFQIEKRGEPIDPTPFLTP